MVHCEEGRHVRLLGGQVGRRHALLHLLLLLLHVLQLLLGVLRHVLLVVHLLYIGARKRGRTPHHASCTELGV